MTIDLLAAVVVGIAGTARLTRLWVDDTWPPVAWLRRHYLRLAPSDWEDLATCAFCAAPWAAALTLGWAITSDLHWTWWLFHGWLGGAYVASMIVVRDTPE